MSELSRDSRLLTARSLHAAAKRSVCATSQLVR